MSKAALAPFKQTSLEERQQKSASIRSKHPLRVPVICVKDPRSSIPNIDRNKFLVPADLTVNQFSLVIRKRVKLSSDIAMYMLIQDKYPNPTSVLSAIYEEQKDEDGFLYIMYSGETTFGCEL